MAGSSPVGQLKPSPATTDAGLRVKPLAVCLANIHSLTRPPDELDWDTQLESFLTVHQSAGWL